MTTVEHSAPNTEPAPWTLADQVHYVHKVRTELAGSQDELRQRKLQFEEQNAGLLGMVTQLRLDVENAEGVLRELAAAEYATTGSKAPAPGITVKVYRVKLYHEEDAIAWAEQHGHGELVRKSLDCTAFNRIADAIPLPFVTETSEARITVARDLSKYVEG